MSDLLMTFSATNGKTVFENDGKTACEVDCGDGLSVRLYYSYNEKPLTLRAKTEANDLVRLEIRDFIIRLFVNGVLADEEFPCGERFLSSGSKQSGDMDITLEPLENATPFTLRKGIKTSEIRLPGVNIGDCMPFSDNDGKLHLFYLYDRHGHTSKWGLGGHRWFHVSSSDLKTWDEHPVAVDLDRDWEGSICTGSVFKDKDENGKDAFYAWYAVRMQTRVPRPVTYAVSYDLERFEKTEKALYLPDFYDAYIARDPVIIFADGRYHMFVTTCRASDRTGCLAHLSSERMSTGSWRDEGPVYTDVSGKDDPLRTKHPECPDVFKIGDYYYLVFSIEGEGRYCMSKDISSGWVFPENNKIPCGYVPKSAIFPKTGERVFFGFVREAGYGGALCGAKAEQTPDGALKFEKIELD